ncbi:unnamed protein product [Symbiodinium pilosum]|uniref:Uncharacterized protein n=1 Tax=Symbiodinium pilosum TaxID=2952 RepID=A0A812QYM8_SYMPI|nr:unnamed protein product [Symbiodinium pilosum]
MTMEAEEASPKIMLEAGKKRGWELERSCDPIWILCGGADDELGESMWALGCPAAVACHGGSEVVSLWLDRGGAEVRWNYSQPASAVSSELPIRWRLRRLLQPLGPFAPRLPSALPLLGIALDEVALVAKTGLLLLLSNSPRSKLEVQALDYAAPRGPVLYPMHDIAVAAQDAQVAFDCSGDLRNILDFRCMYKGCSSCTVAWSRAVHHSGYVCFALPHVRIKAMRSLRRV